PDESDRGATGFRRHSAPGRPTTQKEHDEQGHFFVTNTVLPTTSSHMALRLRPDIYLGVSPFSTRDKAVAKTVIYGFHSLMALGFMRRAGQNEPSAPVSGR